MQLDELKEEPKKETRLMTIMGPNPYGWTPLGNTHAIIDRIVSPLSREYQERVMKEVMDDSKGG